MNKVVYSGAALVTSVQSVDFIVEYQLVARAAIKCPISNPMNQRYIAGVTPFTVPFVVVAIQIQFHDILQKYIDWNIQDTC
jgi:hypothetical protein